MSTTLPDLTPSALSEDPMPVWAWLREHEPVCPAPELGLTLVTRHDDVVRVAEDEHAFGSDVPTSPLGRTLGPNMITATGAAHHGLRDLVVPMLRAGTVRTMHAFALRDEAERLIRGWLPGSMVDLVEAYCRPLAEFLILRLVGLPDPGPGMLERWFRGIALGASNFEQDAEKQRVADAVSAEIDDVLRAALTTAAPEPASVLGAFAAAGATFQDLSSTVKLFIIGGLQEPRDLLGLTVTALLLHPSELALVLEQPALVARAVEEASRWQSPVGTVTRVVHDDISLSGTTLARGTVVAGVLASANRDPRRWSDPDAFVVTRDEGPHVAYGAGPHACVGAPAARLLVREALAPLLPLLPSLRLQAAPRIVGYEFRGPDSTVVTRP